MGGFFGTVAKATSCVADLFYGTDYNSHLGTKRGGLATYDAETEQFTRSIHNLESTYFRTKFEDELDKFKGNSGIGIISDTDPQPLILNSHLGRFAIVTVAKIVNLQELETKLLAQNMHFAELSSGKTNQTELIALLIIQGKTFVEGIENVYKHIKGSCSMLLLTEDGIIAARDRWGRTPIVIGKKDGAYAATSESSSFPFLGFAFFCFLLLCISDDGNGMEERKVADINERLQKSGGILATGESETKGGIALVNVNTRIHLLFGEEYGIQVYSMQENGTNVKIRIPVIYSDRNLIHMEERQENYC